MARRRFFVGEIRDGGAEIAGDLAHHLTQVLRVETGQRYEISDNENVYLAEVTVARKKQVLFQVLEPLPANEPLIPVTLLLSLVKFERLEDAIEKATELGVSQIQLIRSERSEKGLDLAAPKRMPRWERILLEASQQSRRLKLPRIDAPMPFRTAMERFKSGQRFLLDEERTGGSLLDAAAEPAFLLVGPEGGWADHERAAARDAGWKPVSLGPLILRTETAAAAGLAALNSVFYRRS